MQNAYVFGEAEGLTSFDTLLEDDGSFFARDSLVDPQDVALIPYSSGTTGLPKGKEICNIRDIALGAYCIYATVLNLFLFCT